MVCNILHTECSYTSTSTGCTDGEVRLVGGSNETEGTVEVCHNKTWGMVSTRLGRGRFV